MGTEIVNKKFHTMLKRYNIKMYHKHLNKLPRKKKGKNKKKPKRLVFHIEC